MSTSEDFNQLMKESREELVNLRAQLQNLMVKFCLRALKTYQAARIEPLRPAEVLSLIKYELDNVIQDLQEQKNLDAISAQAKQEWEKLQAEKQKKTP